MEEMAKTAASMALRMGSLFGSMVATAAKLGDDTTKVVGLVLEMSDQIGAMEGRMSKTAKLMENLVHRCVAP